jgi:hypothetical protein
MTEFSPSKSRRFLGAKTLENKSPGNKGKARNRDWQFGFLISLAILTFLLALMVSLLKTLSFIIPELGWLLKITSILDKSTLTTSYLPEFVPAGFLISISLLVLSGVLFMAARQRILNNPTMRSEAGCPSCQEFHLVRVHRNRKERLISSVGIPFARYQCRDCQWNGLRIKTEQRPSTHVGEMVLMQTTAGALSEPAMSGLQSTSPQTFEEMADGSENKNSMASQTSEPKNLFFSKELNSLSPLSKVNSWEAPLAEEASTENQGTFKGQENVNDSDCAKIVSPLSLNLRQEPQSNSEVIGTLKPGTIVQLLDDQKHVDGITWTKIRVNDEDGWVLHSFLDSCV